MKSTEQLDEKLKALEFAQALTTEVINNSKNIVLHNQALKTLIKILLEKQEIYKQKLENLKKDNGKAD